MNILKSKGLLNSIFLLSILLLLFGCNINETSQTKSINQLLTEKENSYNLYFFGNNSEESKEIENDFNNNWAAEDYPIVYNTRTYNISDPKYEPDKDILEALDLNKDNTPIFILFNHEDIVLKTKKFDEVINYLNKKS